MPYFITGLPYEEVDPITGEPIRTDNYTSSETENKNNIADKKDVNSGTKKELTEAEFKKEYIREAQKIALYKDPPAFPFIYSKGEGSDRVAVIPSTNLRIFIMGVEVSAWVTAASFTSDASPGVIENSNNFTLQCPNDLFTLTHDNVFLNQWNLNDDFRASEQVKQALYIQKKNKNVYEEKTLVGTWSLTVNTCIFHSSDTVRIFSQIPWTEDDAWLPIFTGYIADVSVQSDHLTGRDTINFSLETIAGKLNKARFLNNPYSIQTLEIADKTQRNPSSTIVSENLSAQGETNKEILNLTDNFAIYKDVINPTLYRSLLTNTTLERVVAFMFYGDIDLTYREENKAINDSLKDLGIPYDKLVGIKGNEGGKPDDDVEAKRFSNLAKVSEKDFLIAYGSDPNSSLRPTLAMIVTRLQDLASEKGSLQEQSDLEKKKQSESGRPLYSNGDKEFYDETWKPIEKNTSLIWKLKVLKYIINSTLQMKSVERKIKSEPAQLKFTVGDLKDPDSLAGAFSILKRGVLLAYSGNDSIGTNYTYKDFNSENSELVRLEIPGSGQTSESIKVEGLKTELTDEQKNEPKSSAKITFKLKNGSIDVSPDSLKIEDPGQGLYYSDTGEITVTLVTPKQDSGSIEFVGNEYEFTSDFKNRYKDFLYKRGWGKLDPRLFALNRQEFPRTGYPDAEIKRLTEAAQRAALTKNNNPILSAEQVESGLKKDLISQYALAVFLQKEIGDAPKWINEIKEINLNQFTDSKRYKLNEGQWVEDVSGDLGRLGLSGEPLGIPLFAYDKTGNKPIEFYSGNFWFDEDKAKFYTDSTATTDGTIYKINNSDRVKEFLNEADIIGTSIKLQKLSDLNFGGSSSEKEKFFSAVFVRLETTTLTKGKVGGLYSIIRTGDKIDLLPQADEINANITLFTAPLYNITNNTIVQIEKGAFQGINNFILPVIENYKTTPFFELYKKINGTDTDFEKTDYAKLFPEGKLKKFGEPGVFGFPITKDKFTLSFGSSKPQYSLHWNNNAGPAIDKLTSVANNIMSNAPTGPVVQLDEYHTPRAAKNIIMNLINGIKFFSSYKNGTVINKNKIKYLISAFNKKKVGYEELENDIEIYTGPVLSFSKGGDNPDAEINNGKLVCLIPKFLNPNSPVPVYFIAWAIEAYNYYKERTGISNLETLFKSLTYESIKSLTAPSSRKKSVAKINDTSSPTPNDTSFPTPTFNLIKPNEKLENDWYTRWKNDKSKNSNAFWVKSSGDYDKNAEKNKTELAKLKSNSEILYTYSANVFEKVFCIQETTAFSSDKRTKDNPYNISEFENEDLGAPPTYDKILNRISKSDPNETGGKNLKIKTKTQFDLVAPADGELLGNENEGQDGEIIYQFMVSNELEQPFPTVHKFIFNKGGDLFTNVFSENTLDKFDQEHERNIANILKGSIYGTTTILDFAKQGKDLNVPLDPILIKRLGRIDKTLKDTYPKLSNASASITNTGISGGQEKHLLDFSTGKPKNALFSPESLKKDGILAVNDYGLGYVRPGVPDPGIFTGSNSSLYEFNKAKYNTIKTFYSRLKTLTENFRDAVKTLLENEKNRNNDQLFNKQNSATQDSVSALNNVTSESFPGTFEKIEARPIFYFRFVVGNPGSQYEFRVYWRPINNYSNQDAEFYEGQILHTSGIVARIFSLDSSLDSSSLDLFITNLGVVVAAADKVVNENNTEVPGKSKSDLEEFQRKVKGLNQWYDSINPVDGRKNGEIVDGLINAYEKNAPAVLPSVPLNSGKKIPVKKGQFLAKAIKAVTWEIYKPASNIPDLFKTAEAELNGPSGLLNVNNAYFTTMSPFAWLKKLSEKDVRDNQLKQSRANKQIDWVYEEYFMADWHKKCVVGFSNGIPKSSLDHYNNQINGLDADAVECLNAANERLSPFLTYDEVTIIGNNSGWEGIYSPHGKTVTVALRSPKYGWGINGGLEPLQYQTIDFDSPIETKGKILSTFMQRLDYFWWVNGNGDVVIDFPHYELIPSHYGPKWEAFFQLEGLSSTVSYSETFRNLKSTYLFTGGMGLVEVGSADRVMLSQNTVVFQLPNVLNRNGIDVDPISLPFITEKARLKLFGLIHIKKQIMNSFTITMNDLPPILYITPNTPIYHAERDIFALVSRVTYQWSINESQVTYRLNTGITAIRQRLNYEQLTLEKLREKLEANEQGRTVLKSSKNSLQNLSDQVIQINQDEFIRPEFSNDTRRIEAVSFYKNETNERTYSNDEIITSDKVAGFIRTDLGVRLDTQSKSDTLDPKSGLYVENARLKQIQSNYGYIYGNRDPILDYTSIYSSNQYVKGTKWQVLENQDESYVATGELVTGNKLNKIVGKIEAVDQKSSIIPLVGTLKDSAKAAAKVLGMSTRNIEYLIKYGSQSVDINTIDDPKLKEELQKQLDSAKTPEEKTVTQTVIIGALMSEFFGKLNKKYNYDPEKKQTDFNPQIQLCLSNLNSYGGSQAAKNPALLITCGLLDSSSKYKSINKEYFTAQDTSSQRTFLNAVKYNLQAASTDTTYSSESSKIQADIKTIDELIEKLDDSKSTTTTSDPQLTPQASQKTTEYPITSDEIKAFQQEKGLTVDGILGPKTMRALGLAGITPKSEEQIKAFQKANKLTVDGIIGPKGSETQARLDEYAKPQSKTLTNSNPPKQVSIIITGDRVAGLLGQVWNEQSSLRSQGFSLAGVVSSPKLTTISLSLMVKGYYKNSLPENIKGRDLAIISVGNFDFDTSTIILESSYDRKINAGLREIRNSINAKKRIWIYPYVEKNDRGVNAKERMKRIYEILSFGSDDFFVELSGAYTPDLLFIPNFDPVINKIKEIIGKF